MGHKNIGFHTPLFAVMLVLLLATSVRFHHLNERPVWTDEGWTIWATTDRNLDDVLDILHNDRQPPLFFLALSVWENVAGDSRLALRFLSVLGGIITTAIVYRVGADWFDKVGGVYAALLYAVLGIAAYYDQEARHYGWLVLTVSLTSLFFLRYLGRPRIWSLLFYSLSVAVMLSINYFGLPILAVQVVLGLLIWHGSRCDKARLVGAWGGAVVLCVPWMRIMFADHVERIMRAADSSGVPFALVPNWNSFWTIIDFLFGHQPAMMLGIYLLGAGVILKRTDRRSVRWLAQVYVIMVGGGLFAAMFAGSVRTNTLTPRTLVFLTPMLVLVCGYGLSRIHWPAQGVLAGILTITMLIYAKPIQPHLNYEKTAQSLAAEYSPGDLIILETGWDDNAFWYELQLALPDSSPAIIRTLPWVTHGGSDLFRPVIPQIETALQTVQRVWVVQWLQPSVVIPFLAEGAYGFRRVLAQQTALGAIYEAKYSTHPVIQTMLFERPNLTKHPLDYEDFLVLHDSVLPVHARAGGRLHVDLWWSAQQSLDYDYSVGVYLMQVDTDMVVAQHDGSPGDIPTSQWELSSLVFDRHTLDLPNDLAPGTYRVAVSVYWFGDLEPLIVENAPYSFVGQVIIE